MCRTCCTPFQVYCNILEDNEYGGIKVMTEPHQICQNTITGKGDKVRRRVLILFATSMEVAMPTSYYTDGVSTNA